MIPLILGYLLNITQLPSLFISKFNLIFYLQSDSIRDTCVIKENCSNVNKKMTLLIFGLVYFLSTYVIEILCQFCADNRIL